MFSKPVALATYLWLLTTACVQLSSAAQDATHEDIRTAIYSFAHTLRDNVDKLERHERREKQSGDQIQNMLLTIVNKQREQYEDEKSLETAVRGLEQSLNVLANAETEQSVDRVNTRMLLESLAKTIGAEENQLTSMLKEEQKSASKLYRNFDEKLSAVSAQIDVLQSRFDALERAAPASRVSNDAIFEMLQKLMDRSDSVAAAVVSVAPSSSASSNGTSQLVQETGHAVLEAVQALSDRLDERERLREESDARLTAAAESAKSFQDDVQNSFRLMSNEVRALSDVEKVLAQTADGVVDTKRRIEYSTHQILMEVTAAIADRSRELNASLSAGLELATKTVLDAQAVVMTNLSVKIETEISQVWRQIGIMYQTLTDSASTLATLQRQTDAFVNGTVASVDGVNDKVSAIGGRMAEVDENLNYLLGRLSLVTQEFKEIKIGLGDALESIRVGLQTVQGGAGGNRTTAADPGPGPNPIDEEPLSESDNLQNALSKTVYTVS